MSDIKVSIICNTYNHELYIRDTLESFLNQRVDFKFEILLHDDASTDKTADIIREYEKKYHDVIKPIYQIENQYSKGNNITELFQYPRVTGEYVAFCEGDDYWTDELKLQKQFDTLERHPEADICAHAAYIVQSDTKKVLKKLSPTSKNKVFSVEDVILGGGSFVATNSLFFRKSLTFNIPDFRKMLWLDYTLQVQGALRGGMIYIPDVMSCYRYFSIGSWSEKIAADKNYLSEFVEDYNKMLFQLNVDTRSKYSKAIMTRYYFDRFYVYGLKIYNRDDLLKEYKAVKKELPVKYRYKIFFSLHFPNLKNNLKKLRKILFKI